MAISDRQLIINTPEQVSLHFEVAGIGSRFMAFLIDSLIQGLCYLVLSLVGVGVIAAFPGSRAFSSFGPKWTMAFLIIGVFLVYWGYFAAFETWWHGQTPGKRYVGIRVVKESGRGIAGGEAMSRNFLRVVDSLPAMYLFGLITMLVSKEKKRIGDYVAGTIVVHEKIADEKEISFPSLEENTVAQDWVTRLTAQDLELIESFLQRRYTLEQGPRYVTGSRMAEHMKAKSGASQEPGESHEDFLQRVATSIRNSRRN
jgi:uncharacterized RDD family membrane protein YckC